MNYYTRYLLLLCSVFHCGCTALESADDDPFSPVEKAFLEIPNAEKTRASLQVLTSIPHVAGTFGDRYNAEFVQQQFLDAGVPKVAIEDLEVRLNYPDFQTPNGKSSKLILWETIDNPPEESFKSDNKNTKGIYIEEQYLRKKASASARQPIRRKKVFEASLSEDLLDPSIDPTTDTVWRNHTFHGYSPSGNLTHTKFVYANYGRPQDFSVLQENGISVNNTIVIMRYGQCFRGLKVRNAQELGAAGVILYSDPADDGDSIGDVYPDGPWRPSSGVQRGSVQFNSKCGGDPYRYDPRYRDIFQTSVEELCKVASVKELVPSIPSIPIGYGDAIPLLNNLGGTPVADIPGAEDFMGGLGNHGVVYRLGISKGYLDMTIQNVETSAKVPNVVGIIPGSLSQEQDQPVLLGNHRDAWVYGAADPNSGTAALLEVARGLGNLYQSGWRPLRSIVFLSWSGEEYGLLGSTGWAELNMMEVPQASSSNDTANNRNAWLRRSLAYLNADTVVSGDHLQVSASPSLFSLWESTISDLKTMEYHTVSDSPQALASRFLQNVSMVDANSAREISIDDDGSDIGILGSGSDYTVFLDHFGIPSLDFSYSNPKAHYGQYHSVYDSFAWMEKFGDGSSGGDDSGSSFELMAFGAKLWGLLAIRLSNSDIVPLDHVSQGHALKRYVLYLQDQIASNEIPFDFRLEDLVAAIDVYAKNAAELQLVCSKAAVEVTNTQQPLAPNSMLAQTVEACNEKLGLTERQLLLDEGLPGRPWFKHCLQAPGLDLGYAAESFPGIQQALDAKNFPQAQEQIDRASERIQSAANNLVIDEATP